MCDYFRPKYSCPIRICFPRMHGACSVRRAFRTSLRPSHTRRTARRIASPAAIPFAEALTALKSGLWETSRLLRPKSIILAVRNYCAAPSFRTGDPRGAKFGRRQEISRKFKVPGEIIGPLVDSAKNISGLIDKVDSGPLPRVMLSKFRDIFARGSPRKPAEVGGS